MKKQIIAGLLAATALLSFGCSGRNAEFGVVDMHAVESKAAVVKTVQEEVTTKGKALQDEMNTALEGKTGDERKKVLEDYTSRMNVIRSEAQNKLKASLAVPQGGVDVTEDVIAKMK